ncbi:MAG: NAD(P)/FAD-dependent oxidoreductase [Promethearchaeota archaeon]
MFDAIISGAGPAGCKCAEVLAKNGFKVALIEKDTTWRKPCGGAVNSSIFKYYPQIRKLNFHHINGIKIYSADFHSFEYRWRDLVDYSITVDRLKFDNILRDIAVDAGAELFDRNLSFDFITHQNRKIGIKTKTPSGIKEFKGKIIIIADGMSSKLAIRSGLKNKWKIEEIGIAKCAILKGENNLDKDIMSLFFKSYKGYGWIFPLEDNLFNIGCGIIGEHILKYDLNQIYKQFLNDPNVKNYLPKVSYKKIWEGGYPLPSQGVLEKSLYGDNIMLIGDNAGFVSPISGEGICSSIVSGKIAAETAINAFEVENISRNTLKNYKFNSIIKKITRTLKLTLSLVDFCFEKQGKNFSKMLKIAEVDETFREELINMFLFSKPPSKSFIMKLNAEN